MPSKTPKRTTRPDVKGVAILSYLRKRADASGYTGRVLREEIEAETGATRRWISQTVQQAAADGVLEIIVVPNCGTSGNVRAYRFLDAQKAVA